MKSKKSNLGMLLILIGSIFFGSGYAVSVLGFNQGMTPMEIIAGRMLTGALFMNIFLFKKLKNMNFYEFKAGIIIGIFLFFTFVFQVIGLNNTTASINAFISVTYVIVVPFLYWLYYKKSPDKYSIIGVCITILGMAFISFGDSDGLSISIGIPITFVSAIFASFYIIYMEKLSRSIDPIKITILMLNVSAFLAIAFVMGQNFITGNETIITRNIILINIYLGLVVTVLPYVLINIGQKYTPATQAAILMSTEAIFGTIISVIFLNEFLTIYMIIGFTLIAIAIFITETKLKFLNKKNN